MAQQLIVDFVAELAGAIDLPEPIVEFGALQVERDQPHDLRPLFAGASYIGTDLRDGPGVDRVEDLTRLTFSDGEVGTALCLDTLEHCADPLAACRELHRVLRPGGVCVITSVMLFPIHDYPHDYWRFTPEGFETLLAPFDEVWVTGIGYPTLPMQVLGVGAKARRLGLSAGMFGSLLREQQRWERAEGMVRFGVVHVSLRELARGLARDLPRAVVQRAGARLSRRP